MSRFAPSRKPSSNRLSSLASSATPTNVPTLAVPLKPRSRLPLGPFLNPRSTSPSTANSSPSSSRASSPASSTGDLRQPHVSLAARPFTRATSYSHGPTHCAVPPRIASLRSGSISPESMVGVLQRRLGVESKRVASVPVSNAGSASEDAAISSYLSLRRSDRVHAQSTVKRYRDLRRLPDAKLDKDLFNDVPDSPMVIGEDSDDEEACSLPPDFELKEQEWLLDALHLRLKVMRDGKFKSEDPIYTQAAARHQEQSQLVAATRCKLNERDAARALRTPAAVIISDQDSESDGTTPPSSALNTPQHFTIEMPQVDLMKEVNYRYE